MFEKAVPVWIDGRDQEMHLRVQFKSVLSFVPGEVVAVRLATSGIYNLFVNGAFVAYGPARAGKGHFRVDEWDISSYLQQGTNIVVAEVCGYYATSYYLQRQPSFLQAEVLRAGKPICWSGEHFTARISPWYVQKTQRYSFQRPMVEAYRIGNTEDRFLQDVTSGNEPLAVVTGGKLLDRSSPLPQFETLQAKKIENGTVAPRKPAKYLRDRSLVEVCEALSGFQPEELTWIPTDECQEMIFTPTDRAEEPLLQENTYAIYELPFNATGNITLELQCHEDVTLYVLFDEILTDNKLDFLRLTCADAIRYELCAGKHNLQLFEVYTMKYIQLVAAKGSCTVTKVGMREYKHPPIGYDTAVFTEPMRKIADAAVETFRQNSVDLFTDCPSRERAGWLCDSFFLGRAEYCLKGNSQIEKGFLENFLHEEQYEGLPEGMFPMCYPADHLDGIHIPNWAMWLVLELEEYLERSNDMDLITRYGPRIQKLWDYFARFENADGLLEKVPSWVFVEWSKANELTQDVNYPTNMVYAAALMAAGRLYGREDWIQKGEHIQQTVREQSLCGLFFCDNALRKDGQLVLSGECTEVCQYYAFYFGIATPESHPELWDVLKNQFGPGRNLQEVYPEIYPANAFIGNYLRLDALMRYGEYEQVKENILGYFSYMADRTGTLWEHVGIEASCNHGFASYVICWLDQLKETQPDILAVNPRA